VEARAFADATRLIGGVWLQTVNAGRYATVLGWLRRFTAEQLRENAALLLIKAWVLSLCGEREEAVVVMAALERLGWSGREPLPDGSTSLEGSLAMLRAAFPGGDVALGHANGLRAVGLQTPESPSWPAACWPLGMACYYRGDFAAADRWFAETVEVGRRDERWVIAVSALAYRSLIAGDRGDLDAQARFAEQALRLARDRGINELDGEAHVAMGASLAAGGELVEALPFLARGVAVARSLRRTLDLANALIRQAAAFRAMARHRDAAAAIAEAVTVVDSCADPGILRERLEALERRPRPRSHRRDARLSERELVILRMLRGPLSERDISRELYLSHNTVHSHTRSIYRKLGVSSRAQALQRALILGLL
jgi:LuxR family maltose regulon positive regulatory protein